VNSRISYSDWKKEYSSILESLSDRDVFMLFSGGKDSSITLDLIARAKKEFGFDFETHAGAFPVHRYPDSERLRIESYWAKRDVHIVWHELVETDDHIENETDPCLFCRELRRRLLKNVLAETINEWDRLVLIIGYSLWDIVSYSIDHILGYIYSSLDQDKVANSSNRFLETAQRFYPLFRMKEGYMVFRPLIKYNNNDILKKIADAELPVLANPCRFKYSRPKRVLEEYYEKMQLEFEYERVFEFAKNSLNLPDMESYSSFDKDEYLLKIM